MTTTLNEEAAARNLGEAFLALLRATREPEASRRDADLRRVVNDALAGGMGATKKRVESRPLLVTMKEAAKLLSVSEGTLRNYSTPRGPIPVVKIPSLSGHCQRRAS